MRNWTDLPPDLPTILRRTRDLKLAGMLYICFLEDGTVQVAAQKGQDATVHGAIDDDPLMAILRVLGPPEGGSWEEHLKLNEKAPKPKPVRQKTRQKTTPKPPPDDDDDDYDVV